MRTWVHSHFTICSKHPNVYTRESSRLSYFLFTIRKNNFLRALGFDKKTTDIHFKSKWSKASYFPIVTAMESNSDLDFDLSWEIFCVAACECVPRLKDMWRDSFKLWTLLNCWFHNILFRSLFLFFLSVYF